MTQTGHPTHNPKVGEDTYSSAIATAHRYMAWMLSPFQPYLRGDVIEVGIGHGSYYETLAPSVNYLGVDIDPRSVEAAKARYPAGRFAQADILQPGFATGVLPDGADGIVSINVLEHVEQDAVAVRNLVDALKPGGTLMISVPALPALYNDLDRLAGHHRRYRLDDFRRMLADLPVHIEKLCYFNPVGGLGWWGNKFRHHDSLNSGEVNGQIVIFEKYILPVSRLLDPITRGFFGQSLICVARKR